MIGQAAGHVKAAGQFSMVQREKLPPGGGKRYIISPQRIRRGPLVA